MIKNITHNDFLINNRISDDTWNQSQCDWEVLKNIGIDYENRRENLNNAASLFAQTIQRFSKVHSVRWRLKDTEHLLEKIVRKCAEQEEKYKNISCENYREIVTDLIGVRALHLFKEECFEIHNDLKENIGETIEDPIVYLREGDSEKKFINFGFKTKWHPAGYRSVHYVFSIPVLTQQFVIELQVRTIFEEGWSEIDHKIRYPNFSDDQLVNYFLGIFNRMAGTADEMGSFVIGLTVAHQEHKRQLDEYKKLITKEEEKTLQSINETLDKLENTTVEEKHETVSELKNEVKKLSSLTSTHNLLNNLTVIDRLKIDMADLDSFSSTNKVLKDLEASNSAMKLAAGLDSFSSTNKVLRDLEASNSAMKLAAGLDSFSSTNKVLRDLEASNSAMKLAAGLDSFSSTNKALKDLEASNSGMKNALDLSRLSSASNGITGLNHLDSLQNVIDKLEHKNPFSNADGTWNFEPESGEVSAVSPA